ncbi:hypothetical protein [Microviridae sp.]|nr:hypothetical protein [Microviridae sp.]
MWTDFPLTFVSWKSIVKVRKVVIFMKRKPMKPRNSKKVFTAGAMRTHPINSAPVPQRGGLRL